jgi:hypothetical protein
MKSSRFIWVTFQRKGFHYYPQAKTEENLSDVSYLGDRHRHLFKFKVTIEVFHDDRELEFHQFLNYVESLFDTSIDINGKSVEMRADDLHSDISATYPGRDMTIEISEDGECGCTINYSRELA